MGLTHVEVTVVNPADVERAEKLALLVDSGAMYSVVPEGVLRRLGIEPHSAQTFTLADGSRIRRPLGDAVFLYQDRRGASPVIFGQEGDSMLLGIITLEALGLFLDPIRRELRPLPMVLGSAR